MLLWTLYCMQKIDFCPDMKYISLEHLIHPYSITIYHSVSLQVHFFGTIYLREKFETSQETVKVRAKNKIKIHHVRKL